MVRRQKIHLAIVIVANVVAWAIPDDVVNLVAKDQQTILGRYARGHFALNLTILVISLIGLYIDQARTRQTYKRRWFQVIAVLLGLTPLVLLGDYLLRRTHLTTYVLDPMAYRRPANAHWTETTVDLPEALFSYPHAPEGFPRILCSITTDARGFRNRSALDHAHVLTLGDSFVEGSHVSDEQAWPVRLADLTSLSICSLGMSGYTPMRSLAALREYGAALKPSVVICLLYEGNDFRSTKTAQEDTGYGLGKLLEVYFKQSPITKALDRLIIDAFGRIGSLEGVKGSEILSWLPVRVPDSADGKYYTFAPKQISDAFKTVRMFESNREWMAVASILEEMKKTCDRDGSRLVLAYAPSKAYVVLPLASDRLPADKVWAFARLGSKRLPEAGPSNSDLVELLGSRETVVRRWCEQRSIPFIGFVDALRQAAAEGKQVYFTYDQHWTPPGHEVVARVVADSLAKSGLLQPVGTRSVSNAHAQ